MAVRDLISFLVDRQARLRVKEVFKKIFGETEGKKVQAAIRLYIPFLEGELLRVAMAAAQDPNEGHKPGAAGGFGDFYEQACRDLLQLDKAKLQVFAKTNMDKIQALSAQIK